MSAQTTAGFLQMAGWWFEGRGRTGGGNVNGHGLSIVQSGKPSWQGKSGDPESQKQPIRLVGEALDAESAAVKYGAMFVTEPEGY